MNTQFWLVQAFNGVSYGALLFLVGSRIVSDLWRHAYRQPVAWLLLPARRLRRAIGYSRHRILGAVAARGCPHYCSSRHRNGASFPAIQGFEFVRNAVLALGLAILVALAIQSWKPNIVGSRSEFLVVAAIAPPLSSISY